jgi:hypothetical protein
MQTGNKPSKTRLPVKELNRLKAMLSDEVRAQLNIIILGLTNALHKTKRLEPCTQYNLNMIVENGSLLLALFDGIMEESL